MNLNISAPLNHLVIDFRRAIKSTISEFAHSEGVKGTRGEWREGKNETTMVMCSIHQKIKNKTQKSVLFFFKTITKFHFYYISLVNFVRLSFALLQLHIFVCLCVC